MANSRLGNEMESREFSDILVLPMAFPSLEILSVELANASCAKWAGRLSSLLAPALQDATGLVKSAM